MTAVLEGNPATTASAAIVAELLQGGMVPGSVVVMPESAGGGRGWLMVQDGAGEQRCCAVVGVMTGAVLAVGLASEVTVAPAACPVDLPVPPWAGELATLAWKARGAETARDSARAALAAQEARLEAIVDAAHEYADENSLCERFDEFMEEQGLRGRRAEYDVEVDVTVRVVVKVTACDADDARGEVDTGMLADAISQLSSYDMRTSIEGHEVNDACRV